MQRLCKHLYTVALAIAFLICTSLVVASDHRPSLRAWCNTREKQEDPPAGGTDPLTRPTNEVEASWLLPAPNLEAGTANLGTLSQARLRAAMRRFLVEKKNLTVGFVGGWGIWEGIPMWEGWAFASWM